MLLSIETAEQWQSAKLVLQQHLQWVQLTEMKMLTETQSKHTEKESDVTILIKSQSFPRNATDRP